MICPRQATGRSLVPATRSTLSLSLPAILSFSIVMAAASSAFAQLTVYEVLRDTVEQIDSRHSDIVKAIAKFRLRDFKGAREFLNSARDEDPSLPPADVLLAVMEQQIGRTDSAIALLDGVVNEFPDEPEPYLAFGDDAIAHERFTEADLLFRKALAVVDEYKGNAFRKRKLAGRAHAGLAAVAKQRGDWPRAAAHLTAWTKADPNSATAFQLLGEVQFQLQQLPAAYDALKKSTQLDTSKPSADIAIAVLLDNNGQSDEAKQHIEQAMARDDNSLATSTALARLLIDAQRFEEGKSYLDKTTAAHPESDEIVVLQGIAAAMLDQDQAAIGYLQQALQIEPKNFAARNELALLLAESNDRRDLQKAVQHAEINALLQPNQVETGISIGWVYHRVGRLAESQQALEEAFRAGKLSPDASYLVARIFYDRGRANDAAQLLTATLRTKSPFVRRSKAQQLLERIQEDAGGVTK